MANCFDFVKANHNRLTIGLKRTPHHFLQVRRRNRRGNNKNAYYNINMAFFIQENANFHLSKLTQLTKKKRFLNVFYQELLCFGEWSSCFTLMTVSDFLSF